MSAQPSTPRSIISVPVSSESLSADPGGLLFLVESLLQELHGHLEILECVLLPSDSRYAIRIHTTRETRTVVLLPRRPLQRALSDPMARAQVRTFLRSAMEALLGRPAGKKAHLTAYFTALDVRSLPGPRCVSCEGPLLAEDPVVLQEGSGWHLVCPPAW